MTDFVSEQSAALSLFMQGDAVSSQSVAITLLNPLTVFVSEQSAAIMMRQPGAIVAEQSVAITLLIPDVPPPTPIAGRRQYTLM